MELRNRLDELLPSCLNLRLDVRRDFAHLRLIVVRHDAHAKGQEIDDALERRLLADRDLHGNDARAESDAQLLDDAVKVRVFAIHLIDEERTRQQGLLRILPNALCLHLDACRRGNDDECAVCCGERSLHVADKVRIARRIKEIDLVILPFAGDELRADRHAAAQFFRLMVNRARLVFDAAETLCSTCIKKASVEQARLARLAMSNDGDVSQICAWIRFHEPSLPFINSFFYIL